MSRALRRELRSIDDQFSERDGDEFEPEELDVIVEGMEASEPRTRSSAVRLLDTTDVDATTLPMDHLQPVLVDLIKQGIDADDRRIKRTAERAARVLAKYGLTDPEAIADLTHLGESMLAVSDPQLRTGGSALLGPVLMADDYEPGVDEVDAMTHHVVMTVQLVDGFRQQIDLIVPALVALANLPDDLLDRVPPQLDSVDLTPFLTASYGKSRRGVARLLQTLAPTAPEFVKKYVPDLTTRLDDDEPFVSEAASIALTTLADRIGRAALEPALISLPDVLEGDDQARRSALRVVAAMADTDPGMLKRVPVERIEAIGRDLDPGSASRERAWAIRTLGAHAAEAGATGVVELTVELAYGTVDGAPVDDAIVAITPLQRGLRDAVLAAPATAACSVPADADWPPAADLGPELPLGRLNNTIANLDPNGTRAELAEAVSEGDSADGPGVDSALLGYWITGYAVRGAFQTEPTVLDNVASIVTDGEQPLPRRRLLAGALTVVQVLEDLDESASDRLASVGMALEDASDDSLDLLGRALRAEDD
ncbi:hypothetical protein [Halopiger aswanensis]|uniref:HEAT repeat protein n=1 Tax=Halopiger aswanensis TaxID=148449 RepID=A0A3R7GSP4_9EURY|nr:hypothetical protein [Halopiger aswanensis]RKD86222.1 hypothetical protein ATJ93_4639 [Halopiger aswanensis]